MALIVEDGTAKSDAESFISVTDADTYFSNRGNATWAALTTTQKEQNLRKGTDYMEQVYRERWKGVRATSSQALSWPRQYVEVEEAYYVDPASVYRAFQTYYYPSDEVPTQVKNACAEMAYKASSGELAPDIDRVTSREKLGPMEVEYQDYGKPYKQYRAIDNMLSIFLKMTGGAFKTLVRT